MSVSLIRSLIPDLGDPPGLTDTQIEACLTLYPNVKLALAECLDILGSNEVLVQKVFGGPEGSVNSDRVAATLQARANRLRSEPGTILEVK